MNPVFNALVDIWRWIQCDYSSNRTRFIVEVMGWAISVGCSVTMAMTVPTPPLVQIYPVWIAGCAMYLWASWTRRSFGMMANYFLLMSIDTIALLRMIF